MQPTVNSPLSILIVDPDAAVGDTIGELLEGDRYAVERASTLAEARQQLSSRAFSVVLVDGRLEDSIRPEVGPAAVIPMLADSSGEDSLDRGNVVLLKPFGEGDLLNAIERAVRRLAVEQGPDAASQRVG
jgi:DNA-binding response OmpR family regulator